jgi:hypothetical protein
LESRWRILPAMSFQRSKEFPKMSAKIPVKGMLAGLAALAIAGTALAQGNPPNPAVKDPAVGAGQQSSKTTPMGTTGTPAGGSTAAGSTGSSTMGASGTTPSTPSSSSTAPADTSASSSASTDSTSSRTARADRN